MAARRTTQPLRPRARGFTLLEVMVAVAILGLGLTAILSAQFGAVKGATHARYMSQATGLARCKMAEVEEQLAIDGYQELDQADSGECCVDQQAPEYSCEWSIQKPMFPEPDLGKLDLGPDWMDELLGFMTENAVSRLPMRAEHCIALASLPFLHRDPFDRMLIVQAQSEKLNLVTKDENIAGYEVAIVW